MKTAICVCALILVTFAAVADETALKSLYDQHRWFELRDALQGQNAPSHRHLMTRRPPRFRFDVTSSSRRS